MIYRSTQVPKYTYTHNRGSYWRGDTIPPMAIRMDTESEGALIPSSVCAQIRNQHDRLIYEYDVRIEGGRVILDEVLGEVSSKFPVGNLKYDIEYRLQDGSRHTFIRGSITILEDVSRC